MTVKEKELLLGNEAIARGAIEAGVSLATGYPGTPSTDIIEYLSKHLSSGHVEWAVNEKVALETAIGASYAGARAICTMKHVGLNVAADALMTIAYLGVRGGLVIAVADDPGAYSSQNEQDSRFYARFAKIPCLEPSDAQEAKDMTILAFELSEEFGLPVMVRSVTRVSHSLSPVEFGDIRHPNKISVVKDPSTMIAVPANVIRCHRILNEKYERLKDWIGKRGLNRTYKDGQKKGIITCGITYNYAMEYGPEYAVLKISAYPFHEDLIKDFVADLEEVWVLEEGDTVLEEIARKYSCRVKGKITGEINSEGELGPDAMGRYIWGRPSVEPPEGLPSRPPAMCQGCPHRELYYALKKAGPSFVAGDIGCYTLGAAPPLSAIDTCLCMGASISKAAGMSQMGVERVVAVIGDSTFLHAGIPALISAVYNKANILVIIMDNSVVAMTGHQPTPSTGITATGKEGGRISLEDICRSCGAESVTVVRPYDVDSTAEIIKEKLNSKGVHVIISRSPCVLAARKYN